MKVTMIILCPQASTFTMSLMKQPILMPSKTMITARTLKSIMKPLLKICIKSKNHRKSTRRQNTKRQKLKRQPPQPVKHQRLPWRRWKWQQTILRLLTKVAARVYPLGYHQETVSSQLKAVPFVSQSVPLALKKSLTETVIKRQAVIVMEIGASLRLNSSAYQRVIEMFSKRLPLGLFPSANFPYQVDIDNCFAFYWLFPRWRLLRLWMRLWFIQSSRKSKWKVWLSKWIVLFYAAKSWVRTETSPILPHSRRQSQRPSKCKQLFYVIFKESF